MKTHTDHAALRPALPAAGGLAFRPPAGSRRALSNGLVVYLLRDDTLPLVHAAALIRTGKIYDPAGKIGLGELTLALLKDGGTIDRRAAEIDDTLDLLGARMEASIAFEEARVTMFSLKKDLDAVLDIFASVILRPAFEEEKVLLKKAEALEMIRRRNDDPARTAQREALRHFYGAGHPYGWRPESSTIEPLSGNDLKAYHARYFRPENIIIAAAGDFGDEDAFLKKLEARFGGPAAGRIAPAEVPQAEPEGKRRVYLIDKDVPQTFISVLQKGIRRHDPEEFPLYIANEILGGGLSSRMSAEIRSRMGLAYSVGSYFAKRPGPGFINAYCGTRPETCAKAISEMLRQFGLMTAGKVTEEELRRAKDSVVNSFVFRFATPFDMISERALYEHYSYQPRYLDDYVGNIGKVDADAVLRTSRALFRPDDAMILVIGDQGRFDRPLSDFGPVTVLKED